MKVKMKKYFLHIILNSAFLILNSFCFGQNKIDSLLLVLKTAKEDTNKVNALNEIGTEFTKAAHFDTAYYYGKIALDLAERLRFKKGISDACNTIGIYYKEHSDYTIAMSYYRKALAVDRELNNKTGMAKRYGNIGLSLWYLGDYPQALENLFQALKIAEELDDKKIISTQYGNIGLVYKDIKDYTKALEYYFKASKIDSVIGNMGGMARQINNIGNVYLDREDFPQALNYYFKALAIDSVAGNKTATAIRLGNIGAAYYGQKKIELALNYYLKGYRLDSAIGNKTGTVRHLINLGSLSISQSKFAEAERYLFEAQKTADEIESNFYRMQAEITLTDLYEKTNREALALQHYKTAMALKDSLFGAEKDKEITRKEMNYEFEKKEAAAKAEQDKKDTVTQIIIYSVSGGFALVLVLAGFIFRGYRQKQRANVIISEQKKMVEEKQKDILDSIHYAKRIQQSLLPTEKYIQKNLTRLQRN
jgi:tetratricopeptide (TPR) repeat protein